MRPARLNIALAQLGEKFVGIFDRPVVANEHPVDCAWSGIARDAGMDDQGADIVVDSRWDFGRELYTKENKISARLLGNDEASLQD